MAENAEMKRETLEKLWAIRTGLSFIGTKTDDYIANAQNYEANEMFIKSQEVQIKSNNEEVKNASMKKAVLEGEKARIMREIGERKKSIEHEKNRELSSYHQYDSYKETIAPMKLSFLIVVILMISTIVFFSMYRISKNEDYGPAFAITLLGFIGCLIWCIVKIYNYKYYKNQIEKERHRNIESATLEMKETEEKLEKVNMKIISSKEEMSKLVNSITNNNLRLNADINTKKEENAFIKTINEKLRNEIISSFQTMVKNYGSYLHITDWQHVDRIIFYFISGRANDLQEALNILDERLNAQMIANSIKKAQEKIASEIRFGSENIKEGIAQCSSVLSDEIIKSREINNQNNFAIMEKIGGVNETILDSRKKLNDNIDKMNDNIIAIQTLTNALQEKANVSVKQLLTDYEYVNRDSGVHQSV